MENNIFPNDPEVAEEQTASQADIAGFAKGDPSEEVEELDGGRLSAERAWRDALPDADDDGPPWDFDDD